MNLFNLTAKLTLDTSDYDKNINNAKNETNNFAEKTLNHIKIISANAWVELASKILSVVSALKTATLSLVNYADKYGDLSAKYDISSQSLQEFEYIASQNGATLETLLSSMTMMYNRAKEGDEVFKKLGVRLYDANGNLKSMDTLFWETKSAIDQVTNSGDQSALMLEAFGRNAMSIGEVLRKDTTELKGLAQEARDLGIVLEDSVVDTAGGINDKIDEFKLRWQSALTALLFGEKDAMSKFDDVLNDTITAIGEIDWIGLGLRIGKAIIKGFLSASWNLIQTVFGKGWLWGKNESNVESEPIKQITDVDVMPNGSYNVVEKSSSTMEIKLTASGTTAMDETNIKAIANELAPLIDKQLGGY